MTEPGVGYRLREPRAEIRSKAMFYLAILPALVFLWIFYKWDSKRPEPPGKIMIVVALGVATCIPAAIIEIGMTKAVGQGTVDAQGGFLNAFMVAALTEEALKLSVIVLYLWPKAHFDEVMDGILYTAAASLGFAMLENVLYVGNNPTIAVLRAFTAVPLHAVCSGLMGYFVGRAKFAPSGKVGWVLSGLAVAVGIHGLYDWAVFSGGTFGFAEPQPFLALGQVIPLVLLCGIVLWRLIKHALVLDDMLLGPHARPLAVATAARPYPGMPVMVVWPDGNRYPATLLQGQGGHYLCAMPNGQHTWVPWQCVAPMAAAA